MARELHIFDYCDVPFAFAEDLLRDSPGELFGAATPPAAERAEEIISMMEADIGGVRVAREVVATPGEFHRSADEPISASRAVEIRAAEAKKLFPVFDGEVVLHPISAAHCQIVLSGRYAPPLGVIGEALDALVLSRVAEASLHRFLMRLKENIDDAWMSYLRDGSADQ